MSELSQMEMTVLMHTPAAYSKDAPAREVSRKAFGSTHAPAVDRTIELLRILSRCGYVEKPASMIHTFGSWRGYKRTAIGDDLVNKLEGTSC